MKGLWITGENAVLLNLSREVAAIKGRTPGGIAAGLMIAKSAALPYTPHSGGKGGGNLRGSMYTRVHKHAGGPYGEIGYTAAYAPYVHEIEKQNYTTPGTGWKFLERALAENHKAIIDAIKSRVRIRP